MPYLLHHLLLLPLITFHMGHTNGIRISKILVAVTGWDQNNPRADGGQ